MVASSVTRGLEADFQLSRVDGFGLEVSLAIPAGRTAALLGPNGAGKSTAVACLSGLLPIDRGHIRLGDETLDDPSVDRFVPPEERRIGVVFQANLLFPHLSVVDNLAFGLRSQGIDKEAAREEAREWLERLGLGRFAGRRPGELSGGQAQQVALARALIIEPEMLLLDEPLSALDVTTRIRLRRALADHLAGFPGPRLFITHDPIEAFLLADEIHVIEEGTITQSGTADDVRLRPRTPYAAELAGSNLFAGQGRGMQVDLGTHSLHVPQEVQGQVLLTVRPNAISVHRHRPEGSARNTWPTRIELIEQLGERVRIRTGRPLPLTAEITLEAVDELGLAEGEEIWLSVKATEIGVQSDQVV